MIDNRNVVMNGLWIVFLKRWDSEIFYAKKNLLMTILNDIILTLMRELDDKGED